MPPSSKFQWNIFLLKLKLCPQFCCTYEGFDFDQIIINSTKDEAGIVSRIDSDGIGKKN